MRKSLSFRLRSSAGVAKGGRNVKIDPKVAIMAPPHEVDITRYVGLFKQFHTIPSVWAQSTLTGAWSEIYRELHIATRESLRLQKSLEEARSDELCANLHDIENKARFLKTYDVTGLSRLSSNLEISRILLLLPDRIRESISKHPEFRLGLLEEIFIHVGMPIEVRGDGWAFSVEELTQNVADKSPTSDTVGEETTTNDDKTKDESLKESNKSNELIVADENSSYQKRPHLIATIDEIQHIEDRIAPFGADGRSTLPGTLHRISAYKGKNGKDVVGFTIRVGKYIANAGRALANVISNSNLLILSRPSVGKTTLLRDLAVQASLLPNHPRVIVIDTSCEIGGDNITPLPFMNRVRRILVKERRFQSEAMLDALQNHSPDYIIVDEIANAAEADAAYTISQRGVKLIATCHAENLEALLQNSQLNKLVGGVAQAFLSNEERRLKGKTKKSVLERPLSSPFKFVVEIPSRSSGILYTDVNTAIDKLLDDGSVRDLTRSRFEIALDEELPQGIDRIVNGVNERNTPLKTRTAQDPALLQGNGVGSSRDHNGEDDNGERIDDDNDEPELSVDRNNNNNSRSSRDFDAFDALGEEKGHGHFGAFNKKSFNQFSSVFNANRQRSKRIGNNFHLRAQEEENDDDILPTYTRNKMTK